MGDDQLKLARSQRKAAVTRLLGTIERRMAENEPDEVKDKLTEVSGAFDALETAHDAYVATLDTETDISAGETWFAKTQQEYVTKVKVAKQWLHMTQSVIKEKVTLDVKDVKHVDDSVSDVSDAVSQSDLIKLLSIPKTEIDKFDGNPLNYQNFISIFDEVIGNQIVDDQVKLTRLLFYTTGEAKSAIKNCALVGGSKGYNEARAILGNRFGNCHLISQAIVNDLKCGGPVSKPLEFRQLADELCMARVALDKLGMTGELNNQHSVISILERCPRYIRSQWRVKALESKRDLNAYPTFTDFVNFIKVKADDVNDPVYGNEAFKPCKFGKSASHFLVSNDPSVKSQAPPVANTRSSGSVFYPCILCAQNHSLFQCEVFKAKRPCERFKVARERGLCFNCLSRGHRAQDCKRKSVCQVSGCGRKHAILLHIDDVKPEGEQQSSSSTNQTIGNAIINADSSNVYRPMLNVKVNGVKTLAFLDNGSTNTLMSESLAIRLGLTGPKKNLVMTTLTESSEISSKLVKCKIESVDGTFSDELTNVCVVDSVHTRYPEIEIDVSKYPYLADVPVPWVRKGECVELLIGMDQAHMLLPLEVRCDQTCKGNPYATRCVLGWTLNGPVGDITDSTAPFVDCCRITLEQRVENLWNIENNELDELSHSIEDTKVIDLWQSNLVLSDGHYTLPIPWKQERPSLPNNKCMAMGRLESQVKRLNKAGLLKTYDENVRNMIANGYAEVVPESELPVNDGSVWYLPHHHVLSEAKPGKVRIVFDCAAKFRGISLNNQCLKGPDLTNKLINVLLKFREFQYGIMADIESMYLQVRVPVKDRNALRFLWYDDRDKLIEYRMTSHLFGGVWCASSSTYALRQTVADLPDSDLIKDTVLNSFYVDDLLKSVQDKNDVLRVVRDTKNTVSRGGFKLRKFVINNAELLAEVPINERATKVKTLLLSSESRALGVKWNVCDDTFHYVVNETDDTAKVTRRIILSKISSMYDPLGQISPIMLKGKMIFQEATNQKLGWDDAVADDLGQRWRTWRSSLRDLERLNFPRCLIPIGFEYGAAELHHFCDASLAGYGACSYLRVIRPDGKIHVSLVASKGRVAPLRSITIPRLELVAAVLAVKLDNLITSALSIPCIPSTFWTDSNIVLAYIRSDDKRFKVFVAHRVATIREFSKPNQWHYISTHNNPADILSRGCNSSEMPVLWLKGPDFLSRYKCDWPTEDQKILAPNDDDMCLPHTSVRSVMCADVVAPDVPAIHPVDALLNHYSSYYKMKKALCLLCRFISYLKDKGTRKGNITKPKMNEAESLIMKHVQMTNYANDISHIVKSGHVSRSNNLAKLCPTLKDGLLVVGGRLKHASMSESAKRPVILPRYHRVSELICREFHGNTHLGTEWVLSQIRQNYWIVNARSLIKKIRRNFVICKRLYTNPCSQRMANLPPERCNPSSRPFTYTGVDLFGPFYVTQGRSRVKRYGCVFTCFSTRAVHIEMLSGMDTDAFINGLMRFVARRGFPTQIRSDNGTNFVGANEELARSFRQIDRSKVVTAARRRNIEWKFNPPHASHHGGLWERMIRTIRKVLVAILFPNVRLTDDVLNTVFCEVENVVNSRPLTKCSDDVQDESPLTPNHLLLMHGNYSYQWCVTHESDIYRRRWRHVQHLASHFWKRWLKEYLSELQRRQKWLKPTRNVNSGDLVLLVDATSPCGLWPLGLVEETKVGRDGLVRSAKIRTRATRLVRPITKLVLLEGVHYND